MRGTIGRVLGLGLLLALMTTSSVRSVAADESTAPATRPTLVAVAIGQLVEDDGSSSTIDLRTAVRNGWTGGTLRFYCPMEGYYNGVVRTLTVENGVIAATGVGGLIRPDGTRMRVRFTATIPTDGRNMTIVVQARDGFEYTMEGHLEPGFVRAGDPRDPKRPQTP